MTLTRYETLVVPNTEEGKKFAKTYEKLLKRSGIFDGRSEDTQRIKLNSYHVFDVKENVLQGGKSNE